MHLRRLWVEKALIFLALACVGFILIQSMIPESKSVHESLWFTSHVLNPLLSRFGIIADKDIVRKIAHAVEFCVLALIVSYAWKKPLSLSMQASHWHSLMRAFRLLQVAAHLIIDIWIDLISVGIRTQIGQLAIKIEKRLI